MTVIRFALLLSLLSSSTLLAEKPLNLKLPTPNQYLFGKKPELFYMYTYRNFEGKTSRPWSAGKYGYVRNLKRTEEGIIGTQFHEGIDIRPLKRDSSGRPLDIVSSIAAGKVVHVNSTPGHSNYGKYVVVEHDWGTGPFYSLYAHLNEISCKLNQRVHAGMPLGKLGYTGAGINRERAHLHLEFNILSHSDYDKWHSEYINSPNYHAKFNGLNMNGLDISELFIRHHTNPNLSLASFIQKIPVYYKVTIPRQRELDIAKRYPWIRNGNHHTMTPAWEISFASTGFPLAVTPSNRAVVRPTVTFVKPTKSNHSYHTKGIISGNGEQATLTPLGQRVIALISGSFLDTAE